MVRSAYAQVEPTIKSEIYIQNQSATNLVAAIDVGTTKICTMLGMKASRNELHILGYSSVPCHGLLKGNVSDLTATTDAIRRSVKNVEQSTGYKIGSAFVGVTGAHLKFENRRNKLSSIGKLGVITANEINNTPYTYSIHPSTDPARTLIHDVKMNYTVDGQSGIRNPTGMHSQNVEVETHLVTGMTSFINKLEQAVQNAGVTVNKLVLEPLASGLAVLTSEEKARGAFLIDIGGGTTDVVGFKNGRIFYTGVIPIGGYQFTNDISVTFDTTYETAELVKLSHGSTDLPSPSQDIEIAIPLEKPGTKITIMRRDVCQLIRERAQELAHLIRTKVKDEWGNEISNMRVVLTGGGSILPGIAHLMERYLSAPVRYGTPEIQGMFPEELKNPSYATSVGIVLWALTETHSLPLSTSNGVKPNREDVPTHISRLSKISDRFVPRFLWNRNGH